MENIEIIKHSFIESIQKKNQSLFTVKASLFGINKFLKFMTLTYGPVELKAIQRDHIDSFHNYLLNYKTKQGKNLKEYSIFAILYRIKAFFRFLVDERYILFDPAQHVNLKRIRKEIKEKILSINDMKIILDQPDITTPTGLRDKVMLELFYSSGLRREELRQIEVYDIDIEAGFVKVMGKGNKERMVPVGREACKYIKMYLDKVRFSFLKNNSDRALFLSVYGRKLAYVSVGAIVKSYLRQAGFPDYSTHSIRHAFATHLLQRNCGIRYIQVMLGHESLDSTQIYTKVVKTDLIKVMMKTHPEGMRGRAGKGKTKSRMQ